MSDDPKQPKKPKTLKQGTELRLVVWTADWCGACQALKKAKTLEALEEKYPEVELDYRDVEDEYVDAEGEAAGADEYDVTHMPALFFEDRNAFVLSEHVGAPTAKQLAKLYEQAKAKLET